MPHTRELCNEGRPPARPANDGIPQPVAHTSETFLLSCLMPNFQLHAVIAFDILRMEGVLRGKRDYEGHLRIRSV